MQNATTPTPATKSHFCNEGAVASQPSNNLFARAFSIFFLFVNKFSSFVSLSKMGTLQAWEKHCWQEMTVYKSVLSPSLMDPRVTLGKQFHGCAQCCNYSRAKLSRGRSVGNFSNPKNIFITVTRQYFILVSRLILNTNHRSGIVVLIQLGPLLSVSTPASKYLHLVFESPM